MRGRVERVKARLEVMAVRRGLDGREARRYARAMGGRIVVEDAGGEWDYY